MESGVVEEEEYHLEATYNGYHQGTQDTESLIQGRPSIGRSNTRNSIQRRIAALLESFHHTAKQIEVEGGSKYGSQPIDSLSHTFVPAVEGLRGVAVCFTVLCHCLPGPKNMRDSMGSMGVTIFFVLSGFLITANLIRLEAKSSSRFSLLCRFYSDRFFRLAPALFFLICLNYAWHFYALPNDMESMNRYTLLGIFYLSNQPQLWLSNSVGPFPHLWSLACEEQFYIIWSISLCLVLSRSLLTRSVILFTAIALSIIIRAYVSMYPGSLWDMHYLYALSPNVYKMLMGSSLRLVPVPNRLRHNIISYIGLLGIMLTIYLTSLPPLHYEKMAPGWDYHPKPIMLWADFLTCLSTSAILCSLSGSNSSNHLLELAPIRFIGRISYAWYLWQIPVIFLTGNVYRGWSAVGDSAVAFIIAMFSTVYVEEPVNHYYKARRDRRKATYAATQHEMVQIAS